MLVLIVYVFSLGIYVAATVVPDTLHNAPIAIVDEDDSPLSRRIVDAFYPPLFLRPAIIAIGKENLGLDKGLYTFVLDIPPDYERDLARRAPARSTAQRRRRPDHASFHGQRLYPVDGGSGGDDLPDGATSLPQAAIDIDMRASFNQSQTESWFGALMEIINNVTMVAMILTGAALIREREHGTIEHCWRRPSRRSKS